MAEGRVVQQKTLTREVLVKELRVFEKRIDNRFEIQTESFKAYVDVRFGHFDSRLTQVENRLQRSIEDLRSKVNDLDVKVNNLDVKLMNLDKKLDIKVDGLAKLIEYKSGEIIGIEKRLGILESKN